MAIRIQLADDSDLLLLGAQTVLADDYRYRITGTARGLGELVEQMRRSEPDVVVCSAWFHDTDVLTVVEQVGQAAPSARLVVMGTHSDGLLIRDLLQSGVMGYLYRSDDLRQCLPLAIYMVMRGRPYLSPTATSEYLIAMKSRDRSRRLDAQSRQVLRMLAQGLPVGQIAERLDVPARRIYWVREKLRRHFDARTNEHLIQRATAEGFIYTRD